MENGDRGKAIEHFETALDLFYTEKYGDDVKEMLNKLR